MSEFKDAGFLIRLAYQGMESMGVDASEVLKRIGMSYQQIQAKDLRTPHSAQKLFWQAVQDVSNDPDIGLHLGENLQADLQGSGVGVQVINPGFIRTRLTEKNAFDMPFLMTPEEAARHVLRAMAGRRFMTSFPWLFSLVFRVGRVLPRGLFLKVFKS